MVSMKKVLFGVVVEKDRSGYFAYCPQLQGCYTQGKTYEKAIHHIKDAIRLHLDDRRSKHENIPLPESVSVTTLEIAA